ncbi:Hypothetical predicted protein, partial [Olea europaea subsp. europaea]
AIESLDKGVLFTHQRASSAQPQAPRQAFRFVDFRSGHSLIQSPALYLHWLMKWLLQVA